MTRTLWARVEGLVEGERLAGRTAWMTSDSHLDKVGIRLGRVLAATAHRLGEIVAYSDEISYLTREHVTYRIRGVIHVDPAEATLRSMLPGDLVFLAPCSSKPDQFGEEHCTFPSVLEYDGSPRCAAGAIRDIEMERACRGTERRSMPLFADENGAPYTYYALNRWLQQLLTALIGPAAAAAFSWHSFRIELACLLRAAGCPDSVIQLMCRWKCPDSVQKYAQIGTQQNVDWLRKAHSIRYDAVRTNNMVALDHSEALAELEQRAFQPRPAPAAALPHAGSRMEVLWGDEWFVGTCTSRRQGLNSEGQQATVYRVLYDEARGHPSRASWHDLAEIQWRFASD